MIKYFNFLAKKEENTKVIKLKSQIVFSFLLICFFVFIPPKSFALQEYRFEHLPYIDCIGKSSNLLGYRPEANANVIRLVNEGELLSPYKAIYIPGDSKTRVRFGFVNREGEIFPNQYIQIGPLDKYIYLSFPCPEGGACLVATDEASGTITYKHATAKTSFPGCP